MRARKIAWLSMSLLISSLASCVGDDPEPQRGQTLDASTENDRGSNGDTGVEPRPDASVISTFCESKITAMGASNVLLCADFDDPSAPLGAFIDGVFQESAFELVRLRGGTAVLLPGSLGTNTSGQRLSLEKPANGNSTEDTGAKYTTTLRHPDATKGLRISFDMIVTRVSPTLPVGTFWLRGGPANDLIVSGEDATGHGKPGNVSFGLISGGTHEPLFGTSPLGSLLRLELVVDPNAANTSCVLSGTLNGVPLNDGKDGGAPTVTASAPLDTQLRLELKASDPVADDGAAVVQYDNVLVRKLD